MRYESLAREALRGVIRAALQRAAGPDGLPGDHHFFITFVTTAPGVLMPERLRTRYPEDMTVVVKRHYWDLDVGLDCFKIGLSFDGQPERLMIPYASITRFFDPAAPFGLEFEATKPESTPAISAVPTVPPEPAKLELPEPAKASEESEAPEEANAEAKAPAEEDAPDEPDEPSGGQVLDLDAFRDR